MVERWIDELYGIAEGSPGFVLGNGWSATYYNLGTIAENGIIIGCNKACMADPIEYLIWQDPNILGLCEKFNGNKVVSRKLYLDAPRDISNTFFYLWGKFPHPSRRCFKYSSSGSIAMQLALHMQCDPIILVGCDCCVVDGKSNRFDDKLMDDFEKRPWRSKHKDLITVQGKKTFENLFNFAKEFNSLYEKFKSDASIYQLGNYGILSIPSVDFPEFSSTDAQTRGNQIDNREPGRKHKWEGREILS